MSTELRQIGTVTLTGPRLHHITYETAAWHSEVILDAGEYPLLLSVQHGEVRLLARIPGTYLSCYLPSLYGGVAIGSSPQGKNHPSVGTRIEVSERFSVDAPEVTLWANQLWFDRWTAVRPMVRDRGLQLIEHMTVRVAEHPRTPNVRHWLIENVVDIARPTITSEQAILARVVNEQLALRPEAPPVVIELRWDGKDRKPSEQRDWFEHLSNEERCEIYAARRKRRAA